MTHNYGNSRRSRLDITGSDGNAGGGDKRTEDAEQWTPPNDTGSTGGGRDGLVRDNRQLPTFTLADSSDIWGPRTRSRSDSGFISDSLYRPTPGNSNVPETGRKTKVKRRTDPILLASLLTALIATLAVLLALKYLHWSI